MAENDSIKYPESSIKRKRVILNLLDRKKPILPTILGGTGNSVAAMPIDTSDTIMIYVDKNHFDDKGQLKPLDDLPLEYRELFDADKVDIIGHGSAGSNVITSDYWAYNFDIPFLRWCPSPFPRLFGTVEIASILKNCQKSPEVELLVCEGAKEKKDYKGDSHKSLVNSLADELGTMKKNNKDVQLPSNIRGYKDMIAITSFGTERCSVWIPITPVEKFSATLIVLSSIIPVLGPLVVGIITGLLEMVERGFRSIFSLFGWCDGNDEIETKRKDASKESVVEVKPQAPLNDSGVILNIALPFSEQQKKVEMVGPPSTPIESTPPAGASSTPIESTPPAGASSTPTNGPPPPEHSPHL